MGPSLSSIEIKLSRDLGEQALISAWLQSPSLSQETGLEGSSDLRVLYPSSTGLWSG